LLKSGLFSKDVALLPKLVERLLMPVVGYTPVMKFAQKNAKISALTATLRRWKKSANAREKTSRIEPHLLLSFLCVVIGF
jgi:hypothetical protein